MGERRGSPSTVIRRPSRLSLAGCSPAQPASVSPAEWIVGGSSQVVKSSCGSLGRRAAARGLRRKRHQSCNRHRSPATRRTLPRQRLSSTRFIRHAPAQRMKPSTIVGVTTKSTRSPWQSFTHGAVRGAVREGGACRSCWAPLRGACPVGGAALPGVSAHRSPRRSSRWRNTLPQRWNVHRNWGWKSGGTSSAHSPSVSSTISRRRR